MTSIIDDIYIAKYIFELIVGNRYRMCNALTSLFFPFDLDFSLEDFGLELSLVCRFDVEALVV